MHYSHTRTWRIDRVVLTRYLQQPESLVSGEHGETSSDVRYDYEVLMYLSFDGVIWDGLN